MCIYTVYGKMLNVHIICNARGCLSWRGGYRTSLYNGAPSSKRYIREQLGGLIRQLFNSYFKSTLTTLTEHDSASN